MSEYHKKIYVSGKPLFLRGFNCEYSKTINRASNAVEYHMDFHMLKIKLFFITILSIPIRPSKICRNHTGGRWLLKANDYCDDDDNFYNFHTSPVDLSTPVGDWGSILVAKSENYSTWWRSNGFYVGSVAILCAITFSIFSYFR